MKAEDLSLVNAEYALAVMQQVVALVKDRQQSFADQHGHENPMLRVIIAWEQKMIPGLEMAIVEAKRLGI